MSTHEDILEQLKTEDTRTQQEIIDMLTLLQTYGFPIDKMEAEFRKRLFDPSSFDGRCKEFENTYKVSEAEQRVIFDDFMCRLNLVASNNTEKPVLLVDMTDERRDNGESTLNLPFDPHDRPCLVM